MSCSPWYSRTVNAVASSGVATQLFPSTLLSASTGGSDLALTATYPPVGGGFVRRPTAGRTEKVMITSDGINGGIVQFWDVAGLDRGASNNVNDGDTMTDAFLTANGLKIAEFRITGTATHSTELASCCQEVDFFKGLAVRFISGAGAVTIAPFVDGGFMKSYVAG